MENLKNRVIEYHEQRFKEIEKQVKAGSLNYFLKKYKKNYKENAKEKFLRWYKQKIEKEKEADLKKIEEAEKTEFKELIIKVIWRKNKTLGKTARVETSEGYKGSIISGWKFDKLSTATAEGLNSCLGILKILYEKEEERLKGNSSRKDFFGCGVGCGALPNFSYEVNNIKCYKQIIEKLGLKWDTLICKNNIDVFKISI